MKCEVSGTAELKANQSVTSGRRGFALKMLLLVLPLLLLLLIILLRVLPLTTAKKYLYIGRKVDETDNLTTLRRHIRLTQLPAKQSV